ncbi:HAD family hydrolase [Mitsuokella sp.]|uniref:HAD family hydrolase n=1 Tax=Mitsuokella TaxID=52225 RepID=UPI0029E2D2D5|nr:HAD family hydrolase [Mitsuokella sp.]MDD6383184.1 HAD family hydrolase [Selenomonadaceae bacterium]MDY4473707.1 HAD family hydrolase [Mitsuokella sp.]
MIKIIFSDMDGTLLDEHGNVPAGFDELAEELEKRGVMFAPASGRQYYSLEDSFMKYKDRFLFLAENGTVVMYKGEKIFTCPMDKQLAQQVLKTAEALPDVYGVFCGTKNGYVLTHQYTDEFLEELDKYYTHSEPIPSFIDVPDIPVKVSFYDPTGRAAETIYPVMKTFESRLQVVLASDYWVDLMNPGINKGVAVREVQKRFGIRPDECAAFGDYMNDAEMMESVYYSFAMGNAYPEIKKLARFETATNEEHGVLLGIRRLMKEGLM